MKILAIDIGNFQVKAVIVETKFKRFDVVLHDIAPLEDTWEPADPERILTNGQFNALTEFARRYGSSVNRVVINLPDSIYSSRLLSFPMKDKRKIQNAVKFAIEDEIPFDIENCIVTSHLFPIEKKQKDAYVLTGFAPLPPLKQYIEAVESTGLPVDSIMMENAALGAMLQRLPGETTRTVAVVNLGHKKSCIYFFRNGLPVLQRTTLCGGLSVTEAIASTYKIPVSEAENAKVERGFVAIPGVGLSPDQKAFGDAIEMALEPVFADFQQTIMAFSSRFNEPISHLYITGGTSLLAGLKEYLENRWNIPTSQLALAELFPQFSIQPQRSVDLVLSSCVALGLSQVNGNARSHINFRSGKLTTHSRGLQLNFNQFLYPAKLTLSIYLVGMISLMGQTIFLKREINAKDEVLSKNIQLVLGKVSASFLNSMKTNPAKLKQSMNKKLEELQSDDTNASKASGISSLDFIQDLSKNVPKASVVEIKQLEYLPSRVTLKVESPNQENADKVVSAIAALKQYGSPKASPIESAKGSRKKYSFTFNLPINKKGP